MDNVERLDKRWVGCIVDESRGIYAQDKVVEYAILNGMKLNAKDFLIMYRYFVRDRKHGSSDVWSQGLLNEWTEWLEQYAEDWLNEMVAKDGCSFGWHEGNFMYQTHEWWQQV